MSVASRRDVSVDAAETDEALAAALADGDLSALGRLYERHVQSVLDLAFRLGAAHDAEDVAQNVFVRVPLIASTYDPTKGPFRGWLLGVTAFVVRERNRTLARVGRMLDAFAAGGGRFTPPRDACPDAQQALARLSLDERTVVVLADVEGMTGREISAALNVPEGTVWTRLAAARKQLRRHLGET